MNFIDRITEPFAPNWTAKRVRARAILELMAQREYKAAMGGRRTDNWRKSAADANVEIGRASAGLRELSRDLVRNNAWARRAINVIANNAIGWGIVPKSVPTNPKVMELWKQWAGSTLCDADGQVTFYGIQRLAMQTIVESGEVLIRRRFRRPEDGLPIQMQLQVLEPDYLDTSKNGILDGRTTIQGVEFNGFGQRTAYWLFDNHPGNGLKVSLSKPVPASEILHIYRVERPGQTRGVSWFAPVLVTFKEFDEYEDATLLRQKIAAMFAAFVTDLDGSNSPLGGLSADNPLIDTFEPGMVVNLPLGKDVKFAQPPTTSDHDSFSKTNLRRIAAGLGVTYEDLTGDYSQVNFSSARMARLAHYENVKDWRWNMLIPNLCTGVWNWAMEALSIGGTVNLNGALPSAEWTAPPMPMIEPDKEGLAYQRLVRNGVMTHAEMIREQGGDPDAHWEEYAAGLTKLDELKIKLDSDVRAVSSAGLMQERVGLSVPAGGGDQQNSDTQKAGRALLEALTRDIEGEK